MRLGNADIHTQLLSNQPLTYSLFAYQLVEIKPANWVLTRDGIFVLELIKKAFLACWKLAAKTCACVRACIGVFTHVCVFSAAYSIQGQNVQIISPSSESHQQVVAVGQPLTAQPQGTVVVRTHKPVVAQEMEPIWRF